MARNYFKGKFSPKNPSKYIGDIAKIIARSSWEYAAFKWCDENTSIICWASEEKIIPYVSPLDGKTHKYYVDLVIRYKHKAGDEKVALIEIKPFNQTQKPIPPKKKSKYYIEECKTYVINTVKWQAAVNYCKKIGIDFVLWTDKGTIILTDSMEFLVEGDVPQINKVIKNVNG